MILRQEGIYYNCKNICDDFDLYKALNGLLKNKNEQNLVSINYLKSLCEKGNSILYLF